MPCTNAVPDTMGNARAYLARDVFARLSAPSLPEEEIDTSSRLTRSRSDSGLLDQVSSEFLRRQEVFEEERRERLGLLQFIMEPPHTPLLSNRSRQLAEKRRQRHPSEVSRRPRRDAVQHDPECSFRPAISADAAVRRARSIDELSTGDRKRQEARTAKLRAEVQAESLKEATFTPHIHGGKGRSRNRLLEDPVERVRTIRSLKEAKREEEMMMRRRQEEERCTFKPEIRQPPQFVSEMAQSYRTLQSLRKEEKPDEKPVRPIWT